MNKLNAIQEFSDFQSLTFHFQEDKSNLLVHHYVVFHKIKMLESMITLT